MSSVTKVSPQQTLEMPKILGSAEMVLPLDDRRVLTLNKTAAFQWDLTSTKLIKSYRAHAELTDSSFSFDGSFVATASRSVKIWDAKTGDAIGKLESPHVGPVRSVHFAPRAIGATRYVFATGGDDGVARIWSWDPDTKKITELRHYVVDGKEQAVQQVRFSPTKHQLLVVGNQGQARVWDLNQPRSPMMTLDSEDAEDFLCGDFSKDGTCVAAAGTDQKIWVWELGGQGAAEAIVLEGHADSVNDLVFLGEKDTLRLMTASSDDTARVWDPRLNAKDANGEHPGGREIVSLRRHTGDVTAVDVTSGGKLLMTAGRDGNVILWPASPPKTQKPAKKKNLFDALD
jgi:WD40 repeat protein